MKATQETITAVSFNTFVWPRGTASLSSDSCQSVASITHPTDFTECLLCVSLCRGGQGHGSRGDRSTLRCHGPGRGHQEMQRSMLSAQSKVTEGTQPTVAGRGLEEDQGLLG